jgi:hypothetical protein
VCIVLFVSFLLIWFEDFSCRDEGVRMVVCEDGLVKLSFFMVLMKNTTCCYDTLFSAFFLFIGFSFFIKNTTMMLLFSVFSLFPFCFDFSFNNNANNNNNSSNKTNNKGKTNTDNNNNNENKQKQ